MSVRRRESFHPATSRLGARPGGLSGTRVPRRPRMLHRAGRRPGRPRTRTGPRRKAAARPAVLSLPAAPALRAAPCARAVPPAPAGTDSWRGGRPVGPVRRVRAGPPATPPPRRPPWRPGPRRRRPCRPCLPRPHRCRPRGEQRPRRPGPRAPRRPQQQRHGQVAVRGDARAEGVEAEYGQGRGRVPAGRRPPARPPAGRGGAGRARSRRRAAARTASRRPRRPRAPEPVSVPPSAPRRQHRQRCRHPQQSHPPVRSGRPGQCHGPAGVLVQELVQRMGEQRARDAGGPAGPGHEQADRVASHTPFGAPSSAAPTTRRGARRRSPRTPPPRAPRPRPRPSTAP